MFLLVSSFMSILSFVYCLDYSKIFRALSNKHFEFENVGSFYEKYTPSQIEDFWISSYVSHWIRFFFQIVPILYNVKSLKIPNKGVK
jgi:hypothetical protein